MPDKIPIYIRVSSDEQIHGTSLASQLKDCKQSCIRYGYAPGKVFSDEGESAKTADRKGFIALLEFIKKEHPPAVVFWKLDRLARNTLDSAFFRAKLKEHGCRLLSATESISDDPAGKFLADLLSAQAEYDNSVRSERARRGMVERVKAGCWTALPPYGYLTHRKSDKRPSLKHDPEKAPLVREAFELAAEGLTQVSIRQMLYRKGMITKSGKMLSKQSFSQMLANPAYAGWSKSSLIDGKPIKGIWKPIVSQHLFDRVQARLKRGVARNFGTDDFPLRGLLRCGKCGAIVTGSFSRGNGGEYAYYHCNDCTGIRMQASQAESELISLIGGLALKEGVLDIIELMLHRMVKEQFADAGKKKTRFKKRLDALEEKMDRLIEMRLEGGIDKERYDQKYSKLQDDILYARLDYTEADKYKIDVMTEFQRARKLLSDPAGFWQAASLQEKHAAFQLIFEERVSLNPKKIGSIQRLAGSTRPIWLPQEDKLPTLNIEAVIVWLSDFRVSGLCA